MNIVLLGPSGVGKGTHASELSQRFDLRHIATGELFRRNLQAGSALGRLAKKHIAQGELVPDEIVDAMIDEWGDSLLPSEGTLFDGFPRTIDQVDFLQGLLSRLNRELDAAVYLHAPDEQIYWRVSGRLVCPSCQESYHVWTRPPKSPGVCDRCGAAVQARPDDTPELVTARLGLFHRRTEPVLRHYAGLGKLVAVPGEGSIASVGAALVKIFEEIRDHTVRFTEPGEIPVFEPTSRAARPAAGAAPAFDLVLLGGPGSGKGTQASRLSKALRLPHIATGDLFRENLRKGTSLGRLAKSYMDRGELVPDDVTDAIVDDRLAQPDTARGFVLDGFPRTRAQAETLDEILARKNRRLASAIYINVPDERIIARLSGRLICSSCQAPYHERFNPPKRAGICDACGGKLYCRTDDAPETVRIRLVTFHRQTEPLLSFYRAAGILNEVDGDGGIDTVATRCLGVAREGEKSCSSLLNSAAH